MGKYSIKDLEHYSGVKAHTIRIWEQRYHLLQPKRTATKIRYYNDSDLRFILNIAFLKSHGMKISAIAKLSPKEIEEKVGALSNEHLENSYQVDALMIAMVSFDEAYFEKVIATNTLQSGFKDTMLNIIYPFLKRIGILWQTGNINPVQEHFVSNLIRQKLITAIDGQISTPRADAKRFLLFLPEGELHEIGLLFAAYLIKQSGHKLLYLGQNLPLGHLENLSDSYDPHCVLSVFTTQPANAEVMPYIETIRGIFPTALFMLCGAMIMPLESPHKNVLLLKSLGELIDLLTPESPSISNNLEIVSSE